MKGGLINMSYEINDVIRVARAHHTYLDDLLIHAASFPREEWMDKGRLSYLSSGRYIELTSVYEKKVPVEIREQLGHDVSSLLKRILDPRNDGDFRSNIALSSSDEHDHDEGND